MNGIALSLTISLIVSVGSCWIFWRWLLKVRPRVKIADLAAFCETSRCLGVKVANLGRHQVTDVEARMVVADRTREGRIITRALGKLNAPTLFAFEPLARLNEPWLLPTVFVFAAINGDDMIHCLKEGHQNSNDGTGRRLLFTISMRDGLSGTKVVERATFGLDRVRRGWYGPARSFEIRPELVYEPSIDTNYVAIS